MDGTNYNIMGDIHSELTKYVRNNDLDAVTQLLESATNMDICANCDDVLGLSAERDNWDIVFKLLEYNADVHSHNDYVLRRSVECNRVDIVAALLDLGADINAGADVFSMVYSPLEISIKLCNLSMVTALLEFGADVHVNDDHILQSCVEEQQIEMVQKLLEHEANLHCADKQILKNLQKNFNEQIADIVLPYCNANDYEYFPQDYIRARIIQTKGANINTDAQSKGANTNTDAQLKN